MIACMIIFIFAMLVAITYVLHYYFDERDRVPVVLAIVAALVTLFL